MTNEMFVLTSDMAIAAELHNQDAKDELAEFRKTGAVAINSEIEVTVVAKFSGEIW